MTTIDPDAFSAARRMIARGLSPIPIRTSEKAPSLKNWTKGLVTPDTLDKYFLPGRECNIGVLNGRASHNLTTVDCDSQEAAIYAQRFFPTTGMSDGRDTKPLSHLFYFCADLVKSKQFKDTNGGVIVELRGQGTQTLIPPSIHPSGERQKWIACGDPVSVAADVLLAAAGALAAATVLGRAWPANGDRHLAALHLSGMLMMSGVDPAQVALIVETAAEIGGDDELEDRRRAVTDTIATCASGAAATGLTDALTMFTEPTLRQVFNHLSLKWGARPGMSGRGDQPASLANELITIGRSAELFHDSTGEGFATVGTGATRETWPIRGRGFGLWLTRELWTKHHKPVTEIALKSAIQTLDAIAQYDGQVHPVAVRVTRIGDEVFHDLGGSSGVIRIDSRGWQLDEEPPVHFVRPNGSLSLPLPRAGAPFDVALRPLVNFDPDDFLLFVAYLAYGVAGHGPFPILVILGEQGSAKTSHVRLVRRLIDPAKAGLRIMPKSPEDLALMASHRRILAFDNVSALPEWLSDVLCQIATGGSFGTRQFYTNTEEVLFEFKRPIVLNGIEDMVTRGDLADRSLSLTLPRVSDQARRAEDDYWSDVEAALPTLLGGLYDAVRGALDEEHRVAKGNMIRLADFERFSIALGRALGWEEGSFSRALRQKRRVASANVLDNDPVARVLLRYAKRVTAETTEPIVQARSASDWLQLLGAEALSLGIDSSGRDWPKQANRLRGTLTRLAPDLLRAGIDVADSKRQGSDSVKVINITFTPTGLAPVPVDTSISQGGGQ